MVRRLPGYPPLLDEGSRLYLTVVTFHAFRHEYGCAAFECRMPRNISKVTIPEAYKKMEIARFVVVLTRNSDVSHPFWMVPTR